jgi:hypothetical protein
MKMDLREIGWGGVEWIHQPQDRDCRWAPMNVVMNLRVLAMELLIVFSAWLGLALFGCCQANK